MTGADVAGLISAINSRDDRNDGFFGDGIWGIIMLLIIAGLFSGNGFGFGDNRTNGLTEEYIANQFTQRDLYNNNTNILGAKYDLATQILENRYNCSQNANATQKEILQNRYDTSLGLANVDKDLLLGNQNLQAQLSNCCCTLENAIHSEGEATRNMIQQDKIDQLREQVNTSNLALFGQQLVNQILPRSIPSYLTTSPYIGLYNPYGSCGCSNSTII